MQHVHYLSRFVRSFERCVRVCHTRMLVRRLSNRRHQNLPARHSARHCLADVALCSPCTLVAPSLSACDPYTPHGYTSHNSTKRSLQLCNPHATSAVHRRPLRVAPRSPLRFSAEILKILEKPLLPLSSLHVPEGQQKSTQDDGSNHLVIQLVYPRHPLRRWAQAARQTRTQTGSGTRMDTVAIVGAATIQSQRSALHKFQKRLRWAATTITERQWQGSGWPCGTSCWVAEVSRAEE